MDLNAHLVKHPAATFFVRVQGDSMQSARIFSGDLLIVDRSLEAKSGHIVLAVVNGEFTVKRILKKDKKVVLASEDSDSCIQENMEFQIWGVVTYVIHKAE